MMFGWTWLSRSAKFILNLWWLLMAPDGSWWLLMAPDGSSIKFWPSMHECGWKFFEWEFKLINYRFFKLWKLRDKICIPYPRNKLYFCLSTDKWIYIRNYKNKHYCHDFLKTWLFYNLNTRKLLFLTKINGNLWVVWDVIVSVFRSFRHLLRLQLVENHVRLSSDHSKYF